MSRHYLKKAFTLCFILSYSVSYERRPRHYEPPNAGVDTVYITRTDTIYIDRTDTIVEKEATIIRDTIRPTQDTVFMYQDVPTQAEVETAEAVLHHIMEDKDLTALIKETVKDMSAEELQTFRKELQFSIKDMNDGLKQIQNQKVIEELEAKREAHKIAKEARQQLRAEQKAVWDTLSKEER